MVVSDNPWILRYTPRPSAKCRLLCFPHAGSGAAAFGSWGDSLPDDLEVWAIEYPGRGSRRAEPPFVRLKSLVAALFAGISRDLTGQFAFFGHSMGAFVAFELARQLQRHGVAGPAALCVAGSRAPSKEITKPPIFSLSDDDLVQELQTLNGTPKSLLGNRELLALFLPTLRADFEAADTYVYRSGTRLQCPIFAYYGADDREARAEDVDGWAHETARLFTRREFLGDHFFLRHEEARVLSLLVNDLSAGAEPTN